MESPRLSANNLPILTRESNGFSVGSGHRLMLKEKEKRAHELMEAGNEEARFRRSTETTYLFARIKGWMEGVSTVTWCLFGNFPCKCR